MEQMSSFPSHGCYKVNGVRTHPRTLEVETKDKPLPASFYDVDVYFSGVVKYYTEPPQEDWVWNKDSPLDCIRQVGYHKFAVRREGLAWILLDVDKRTATRMVAVGSNCLPLTENSWLIPCTNGWWILVPHGFSVDKSMTQVVESSVFPCENVILSKSGNVIPWSFYGSVFDGVRVNLRDGSMIDCLKVSCLSGERSTNALHRHDTHIHPWHIVYKDVDYASPDTTGQNLFFKLPRGVNASSDAFITNDGVTIGTTRVLYSEMVDGESTGGKNISSEITRIYDQQLEKEKRRAEFEVLDARPKKSDKCKIM